MSDEPIRNPLIIPEAEAVARGCPVCKHQDYNGRRIGGVVVFTCGNPECRNQWQGGLPMEPQDPRVPYPHDPHTPSVTFERGRNNEVREILTPVKLTPAFRTGERVPEEGEDEYV
jgi:hypothetical protein